MLVLYTSDITPTRCTSEYEIGDTIAIDGTSLLGDITSSPIFWRNICSPTLAQSTSSRSRLQATEHVSNAQISAGIAKPHFSWISIARLLGLSVAAAVLT